MGRAAKKDDLETEIGVKLERVVAGLNADGASVTLHTRVPISDGDRARFAGDDHARAGASTVTRLPVANHDDGGSPALLRAFIERIETLEAEKAGIAGDIKAVYAEAKGAGFDVPTMRAVVRLRKMEAQARAEAEALLDTYKTALQMDLPL